MAVIREHLAAKGLGLFNDLQNEHSVCGNFPDVIMVYVSFFENKLKKKLLKVPLLTLFPCVPPFFLGNTSATSNKRKN